MVFGKDQDAKKNSIKGAKASHASGRMRKGQARRMGLNSRKYENQVAKEITCDEMFLPQEVCDRIIVIDGKVIFIEIKHPGEELKPNQKRFKELMGDSFQIIRGE